MTNDFRYRPDIDGLRAVAVLLVLVFHAGLGLEGGFIGVDVFFVISGFLITGLIFKGQANGTFRLADFWERRIRRIIPAASAMVAATMAAGYWLLLPDDYSDLGSSAIMQQLMVANFYFWRNTGYFDGPADVKPLLHTWSLSVEEQFYLGYPFALAALKNASFTTKGRLLATACAASLAISIWGSYNSPSASFYLLPTRAWELLFGGLICFAPTGKTFRQESHEVSAVLGLAGILLAAVLFNARTPFPGFAAMFPCASAALLIYANSHHMTAVGRLLTVRPMVFVGLLSYSLYLWHWPILAFLRYWRGRHLGAVEGVLALAGSFIFAYLSWRFVEAPFRQKRGESRTARVYAAALTSLVLLVGSGLLLVRLDGIPSRFPAAVMSALAKDNGRRVEARAADVIREKGLPLFGTDTGRVDLLLWGDSHAEMIAGMAEELARKYSLCVAIAVDPANIPLLGIAGKQKQVDWNLAVIDFAKRNRVRNILLVARWENVLGWQSTSDLKRRSFKELGRPEQGTKTLRAGLQASVEAWKSVPAKVQLMLQVPFQEGAEPNKRIALASWLGLPPPEGVPLEIHRRRQAFVNEAIEQQSFSDVTILDPTPLCFSRSGLSRICDEQGRSLYKDDDHLSPLGVDTLLRSILDPVFAGIAEAAVNYPEVSR